jgi:TPR repeat protein
MRVAAVDVPAIDLASPAVAVNQVGIAADRGRPAAAETAAAPQGVAAPVASPDKPAPTALKTATPVAEAASPGPLAPVASPPVETAAEAPPNAAARPEPARDAVSVVPGSEPTPAGAAASALKPPPVAPLPVVGSPLAPAPVAALPVVGSTLARPADAAPAGPADGGVTPPTGVAGLPNEPTRAGGTAAASSTPPAAAGAAGADAPAEAEVRRAQYQIAAGHLADPPGDNAIESYRGLIGLAPGSAAVQRLLGALRAALGDAARDAVAAGRLADAQRFYELALTPERSASATVAASVHAGAASATAVPPAADQPPARAEPPAAPPPDSRAELRPGDAATTGSSVEPEPSSRRQGDGQLAARPPPAPEQPAATVPRPSAAELATLIDRGDQLLAMGDIAAARLFYERAAESGSARAATSLGKTYDPVFFKGFSAVGIRPDAAVAATWYRRAAEMDAAAPPSADQPQATAEPPAAAPPDSRAELRPGDAATIGSAAATVPRPSAAELATLIDRGDRLLAMGDIAAARLFYERAAESGSARATTSLGKTYDPVFFKGFSAVGIRPDAAVAAAWYRRAAEMGDSEAPARLQSLETFTMIVGDKSGGKAGQRRQSGKGGDND